MLASVTNKAKALGGLNSKFIPYTLKDLQGLCSKQLFKDLASSTFGSTLLLDLGQLSVQPDNGEREALVGGLWKQPCMDVVHLFHPYPTGQKSNGYMCNCEGGWERWCSSVPRRKGR